MAIDLISPQLSKIRNVALIGAKTDGNDVVFWYRDENGNKRTHTVFEVPLYFCLSREDFNKLPKDELSRWKADQIFDNGVLRGQYAYFYSSVPKKRSQYFTWLTEVEDTYGVKWLEADIQRQQRLMVDYGLTVASMSSPNPPRMAYYDIETDDRGHGVEPGRDRILSIVIMDHATQAVEFLYCPADNDDAEREFLQDVYYRLSEYDVIVGYNSYAFDEVALTKRWERYGIETFDWRNIHKLDYYNLMERQGIFSQYNAKNKKLDTIAKAVVGRGKVPHDEGIYDLWQDNLALLKQYNIEDVRLMYDMEQKLGAASLVIQMCAFSGTLHSQGYSPAKVVDNFLLKAAAERRKKEDVDFRYATAYYRPEHNLNGGGSSPWARNALAADNRKGREEELAKLGIDYEPVQGAYVHDVEPGLYHRVAGFDFNSLYPSQIMAFNIGHDTIVEKDAPNTNIVAYDKIRDRDGEVTVTPRRVYFRTDIVSAMAQQVEFLLGYRKKLRAELAKTTDPVLRNALDVQQRAVKELTNSFYGVTAQWGGRYYNRDIAEAITASGRIFLGYGEKHFGSRNQRIVMGDTDSMFVELADGIDPEKAMTDYVEALREYLKQEFRCYRPEVLKMSYEKLASTIFCVMKKNYAMRLIVKDGKEVKEDLIKGLQFIKGNMCKWSANVLRTIVTGILDGKPVDWFERLLQSAHDQLAENRVPVSDLLIAARLGKPMDQYVAENALIHVRIARRMVENGLHVAPYATINYMITDEEKVPGKSQTILSGISEEEFQLDPTQTVDGLFYWNSTIDIAARYLEIIHPEIDWEQRYAKPRFTYRVEHIVEHKQLKTKVKVIEKDKKVKIQNEWRVKICPTQ